ncbi:hypothetical protein EJ05DRAFT_501744 [Pseudovirgaria hyperparasitica]|uniref:Uncharacterized protein n=1 Tax=Pseudovirgaria hyperparasitica TaxID=470096 RepID=A0A6A6W2Y0_9PEZI|nr:uncharacterized protein EJ05DRAFT_501744 [Pseudovirgaria hyperparasitica]KAF2757212.1 hypothetical protein EJ05DRAFT_501744 [Pseudovirgaria hyperparasitica]
MRHLSAVIIPDTPAESFACQNTAVYRKSRDPAYLGSPSQPQPVLHNIPKPLTDLLRRRMKNTRKNTSSRYEPLLESLNNLFNLRQILGTFNEMDNSFGEQQPEAFWYNSNNDDPSNTMNINDENNRHISPPQGQVPTAAADVTSFDMEDDFDYSQWMNFDDYDNVDTGGVPLAGHSSPRQDLADHGMIDLDGMSFTGMDPVLETGARSTSQNTPGDIGYIDYDREQPGIDEFQLPDYNIQSAPSSSTLPPAVPDVNKSLETADQTVPQPNSTQNVRNKATAGGQKSLKPMSKEAMLSLLESDEAAKRTAERRRIAALNVQNPAPLPHGRGNTTAQSQSHTAFGIPNPALQRPFAGHESLGGMPLQTEQQYMPFPSNRQTFQGPNQPAHTVVGTQRMPTANFGQQATANLQLLPENILQIQQAMGAIPTPDMPPRHNIAEEWMQFTVRRNHEIEIGNVLIRQIKCLHRIQSRRPNESSYAEIESLLSGAPGPDGRPQDILREEQQDFSFFDKYDSVSTQITNLLEKLESAHPLNAHETEQWINVYKHYHDRLSMFLNAIRLNHKRRLLLQHVRADTRARLGNLLAARGQAQQQQQQMQPFPFPDPTSFGYLPGNNQDLPSQRFPNPASQMGPTQVSPPARSGAPAPFPSRGSHRRRSSTGVPTERSVRSRLFGLEPGERVQRGRGIVPPVEEQLRNHRARVARWRRSRGGSTAEE